MGQRKTSKNEFICNSTCVTAGQITGNTLLSVQAVSQEKKFYVTHDSFQTSQYICLNTSGAAHPNVSVSGTVSTRIVQFF